MSSFLGIIFIKIAENIKMFCVVCFVFHHFFVGTINHKPLRLCREKQMKLSNLIKPIRRNYIMCIKK